MLANRVDPDTGATGFIGGYTGTVTGLTDMGGGIFRVHFQAKNSTNVDSGGAGPANRPVDQTWSWYENIDINAPDNRGGANDSGGNGVPTDVEPDGGSCPPSSAQPTAPPSAPPVPASPELPPQGPLTYPTQRGNYG
jgi:hypothetical protein